MTVYADITAAVVVVAAAVDEGDAAFKSSPDEYLLAPLI